MTSIISEMKQLKQILLATATIDENFSGKRLKELLKVDLEFIKFSTFAGKKTVNTLIQKYVFTPEQLKAGHLLKILDENRVYKIIVFVKTCKECTLIS